MFNKTLFYASLLIFYHSFRAAQIILTGLTDELFYPVIAPFEEPKGGMKTEDSEKLFSRTDEPNWQLFPNPSQSGLFYLQIPSTETAKQLFIIDQQGRLVQQSFLSQYNEPFLLDISQEPKGIYYVRIVGDNTSKILKIVKQ